LSSGTREKRGPRRQSVGSKATEKKRTSE
jgi:hypothetical protein